LRFLDINRYAAHNRTQPKFLVDLLPEIYCGSSEGRLRQLLLRALREPAKVETTLRRVDLHGCVYLPSINVLYVREFQMMYVAEEAARFLHHACRGLPLRRNGQCATANGRMDRFYARTVEHALAYFGSLVLYPARRASLEDNPSGFSYRLTAQFAKDALRSDRAEFDSLAEKLGFALGSQLYQAYLRGSLSRTVLRHFFLAHIDESGKAKEVCQDMIRRIRCTRKKPCASARALC